VRPLSQEIPALVERYAELREPPPIGVRRRTSHLSLPELMRLFDHRSIPP